MSEKWSQEKLELAWMQLGDTLAEDPYEWERYSRALQYASEICWIRFVKAHEYLEEPLDILSDNDRFLREISNMLLGLAIETQLKAHLLRKDRDWAKGDKFYTHTLVSLAQKVGIQLNKTESNLLEALTHHIEWKGRYPIPRWDNEHKKGWKLKPKSAKSKHSGISAERIPGLISDENRDKILELLDKIHTFEPIQE